jgi:hypothetical protein
MHQINLLFFLLVSIFQATAVSTSSLAKIKAASADLDALLSQPVSGSKADHDAVLKKINDLFVTIEKSGDTKAALKYKGLVETKKQAIELSEKNVELKAELVQTGTQVAVQEKQLAKAEKKLESVGMSLPKAKTTVSDLIGEIDSFMNDFTKNADESNLDSFEQKITTIIQKALKKAETQDVKNKIEQFRVNVVSIIYQKSLDFFEDGLKGINTLCIDQHNTLESCLDPFLTDFHSAVFGQNLEYEALVLAVQDSTEQVKTMHQLFKVYCMRNGFSKKTLLQLDETDKNAFGHIFDEFIKSYETILLLWLDAIETINAQIENLKDHPELELATWERMRYNSDDFVTYFASLVLFKDEVLAIIPNEFKGSVSPTLNALYLLDLWDSFAHKKIGKSGVASSIPKPPLPMPKQPTQPLFVSEKPEVQDPSFNQELVDTVAKGQSGLKKAVEVPSSPRPVKSPDSALFAELKKKQQTFVSEDQSEKVDLEQQLRTRIKTFEKIEARIKRLANFENSAAAEAAYLKIQFDTVLYDKFNAQYSPHGTVNQYYEDIPELDSIAQKLDKKMIDSKKTESTVIWTEDQKKRFKKKQDELKQLLDTKKKLIYEYGYDLAIASTKIIENFLTEVTSRIDVLLNQVTAKADVKNIKLDSLQEGLSYFYFMVRFGIHKPIQKIPSDNAKKSLIGQWCNTVIEPLEEIVTRLTHYKDEAFEKYPDDKGVLFGQFGQRVIAPLTAVIDIIIDLSKDQSVKSIQSLQKEFFALCTSLIENDVIQVFNSYGLIENFDNYIVPSLKKKRT